MDKRYLARRVGQGVVVVWLAYTVTFIGIELLPSDPITAYLTRITNGASVPASTVDAIKSYYGYDKPAVVRYFSQLAGVLTGDLGYSLSDSKPVGQRIFEVIGPTLTLALSALAVALVITFVVLLISATSARTWLVAGTEQLPAIFNSIPSFCLGILCIQFLSFRLGILPLYPGGSFVSEFVPALVLGIGVSAPICQVALKALRDVQRQPFLTVARAKGLSRTKIFFNHILKHAAASILTMVALVVGFLLTGAIVVEKVFGRTGIGSVLEKAVTDQDFALIQGFVVLVALAYVVLSLTVDLLYPVIDPRVRLAHRSVGSRR
ncbi:ABC transporter permease [Gordonia sp. NB41Y]|uniref:ABC transporter permease n=1 Tax=Gordonia sp. NB41Y TaxID=875808 RepID=UPI0006B1DBC2|nr:ABC transporter permease [Gordonia sp. NB41Y]KOY50072.1 hypothetical protein ISGA_06040 [Gordonia sp. NB41Y]WLP88431.1 ABC transporter permease [Gordonia sp. NB41Y]